MASESDERGTQTGSGKGEEVEAHVQSAWRSWLSALATDAEAAMAAALAYESLPAEGRDAWLDALEVDAPTLGVPSVALYAPLLAVETDEERRARIELSLAASGDQGRPSQPEPRALLGVTSDGTHACIIAMPLYLDFVEILSCRYTPSGGFVTATHDPLRHSGDLAALAHIDGVTVEPTPLRVVVEELAHAILADKRSQRQTPPALATFAHLFAPQLEDAEDAEPPTAW
jgi:hypothetical protein